MSLAKLLADFPQGIGVAPATLGKFKSYSGQLAELITTARETVKLVVPFIDTFGTKFIAEHLAFNHNHPETELISRDITRQQFEALKRYDVKVFTINAESLGWGFHSKYALIDHKTALVGSENLTERSIMRNVEIGILLEGKIVRDLLFVHRLLLSKSKQATQNSELPHTA